MPDTGKPYKPVSTKLVYTIVEVEIVNVRLGRWNPNPRNSRFDPVIGVTTDGAW